MKIEIWTIGKEHDPDLATAIEKYENRISHYAKLSWKIINPSKKKTEQTVRQEESDKIIQLMQSGSQYILLDERGQSWDNTKWSKTIENHAMSNPHALVYIIGGAHGVSSDLRKRATTVSISPLVMPHQIMRLILVEQLYRSFSILHGTGYHHV